MDREDRICAREALHHAGCSLAHSIHELYRLHKTFGDGLTEKEARYAARLEKDAKDLLERSKKLRIRLDQSL